MPPVRLATTGTLGATASKTTRGVRGGLTDLRKIAAIADTWGLQIAPHCFHELMVHLMASIPNANYLEYMDWNDDLWVEPAIPVDGMVRPSETPGHGVRFRPDVLSDSRVGGFEAGSG
jgi:L-alanine-DL-glutamate epimerase-like enolase superfamily enzyme